MSFPTEDEDSERFGAARTDMQGVEHRGPALAFMRAGCSISRPKLPTLPSRPCFIHIGTHKTGTTAIQVTMRTLAETLRREGVLYPSAAVYHAGHHNIVFEMLGDERFDLALGTLDDLCEEIRNAAAERICLSSEAFEYLHASPQHLAHLRDAIRALGYTPVVLLYVRPQADYVESLFAEMTKHRHAGTFSAFLEGITVAGAFRANVYGCTETFTFTYDRIASDFAATFGAENVAVRRYDRRRGAVIEDFLDLVAPGAAALAEAAQLRDVALNSRDDFACVAKRMIDNDLSRHPEYIEGPTSTLPFDELRVTGYTFAPLTTAERRRLERRFAESNAALARTWGVDLRTAASGSSPASTGALTAQRLFRRFDDLLRTPRGTERIPLREGAGGDSTA